ncbi:MAG TPA: bifunctional serine/threonine-protein kinase/formylglycine-generating enzyme family protein [Gemmatimonadales bacterium]|nr:bifunctional serine/threonine-protein kinase/formylglycine-generating enzyme family protein [Gemmatimonadales bacterium]
MTARPDDLAARLQAALGAGYAVERPIGQGGFAAVYLVRDLTLKRPLAVKVLSPDLLLSATAQERFRREAETIAQLSHPNIVPLHFIGNANDIFYLAMAYVDGESLADRIDREKRIDVEDAARILREVASALDLAHRRGVIHRDIKPHNVLLERDSGRALVTDFGIARTAENSSLTASGMVVGTPTYMSPEQVVGDKVDHRADLYALGVVGYEMLAGRPPFSGTTPTEVLMKRVATPAEPVQRARPDAPPALADVIDRCLQQDPAARFATGGEIVRALGGSTPISGGHTTAEVARAGRRATGRMLLVGGALLALLAVAGLWQWRGRATRRPRPPAAPSVPAGMVLIPGGTYTIGRNDGPRWSQPAHPVTLAPFYLDRTEVTVGEYQRFLTASGGQAVLGIAADTASRDSLLPVTGVMWSQAMYYCGLKHGPGARLPTEEEWEAAARGAQAHRFPWGDAWVSGAANVQSTRRGRVAPAGSFPLGDSPQGVSDLIGNAWEWTASPMKAYPGGSRPPRSADTYVIRGGGFNTPDSIADATYRGYQPAVAAPAAFAATGFRCMAPAAPRP